jgi:ubiquinone biosynthesis protein UbiJ
LKLPSVALAAIETALNRLIQDQLDGMPGLVDPVLDQKTVCIDLQGLDLQLYLHFFGDAVTIMDDYPKTPDASIRGTPVALAGASKFGNAADVKLDGDLKVAQALDRLLHKLEFDWEEYLSRYTGDAIAYQIGQTLRGLTRWGEQSAMALADDVRDYLQIESRQLPSATEVDAFNRSVDDLRAAVERLELRIRRMQERVVAMDDKP